MDGNEVRRMYRAPLPLRLCCILVGALSPNAHAADCRLDGSFLKFDQTSKGPWA